MVQDNLISIIIPAWNGEQFLSECIRTVADHTPEPFEIIVVDNGSDDESAQIAARHPRARVIRNTYNTGFARAVNQGLRAAGGQVILLLNQDTVTLSDWSQAVMEELARNDRTGVVGCKLLYPDGRVQHAGAQLIEPLWDARHLVDNQGDAPLDFVTGAAFVVRRSCLLDVGLFDEAFFPAYYEDVDFCLRARLRGWQIAYAPGAIFTHFESQSRGDNISFLVNINTQRLRLLMKHRDHAWLQMVFYPAEAQRLRDFSDINWMRVMAHVYLRAMCDLADTADSRATLYPQSPAPDKRLLGHLLANLRREAIQRLNNLLLS